MSKIKLSSIYTSCIFAISTGLLYSDLPRNTPPLHPSPPLNIQKQAPVQHPELNVEPKVHTETVIQIKRSNSGKTSNIKASKIKEKERTLYTFDNLTTKNTWKVTQDAKGNVIQIQLLTDKNTWSAKKIDSETWSLESTTVTGTLTFDVSNDSMIFAGNDRKGKMHSIVAKRSNGLLVIRAGGDPISPQMQESVNDEGSALSESLASFSDGETTVESQEEVFAVGTLTATLERIDLE